MNQSLILVRLLILRNINDKLSKSTAVKTWSNLFELDCGEEDRETFFRFDDRACAESSTEFIGFVESFSVRIQNIKGYKGFSLKVFQDMLCFNNF